MNFRLPLAILLCSSLAAAAEERGPLNEHLPSWLSLGAQVRWRGEGQSGVGFQEGAESNYLLERYRFDVRVQPLEWMTFFGQFQDSRTGLLTRPDASVRDRADVRQAYVMLGRENGWWDVKAGRQRLIFGSERVVGAAEWGNTARAFDAVRLALHHKGRRGDDRVDLFASSVVNNSTDAWDHHQQGNNLHGIYASMGSWLPGAKVEPYVLWRTAPRFVGEPGMAGAYGSWTYGLRSAGAAGRNWNYEAELLGQRGHIGNADLRGYGATVQVQRHLRMLPWQPTLLSEGNYASGDRRAGDGVVNTLDQLYPTNHGIYGVADQIGRRNNRNVRAGVWLHPEKRLTLKAEGHHFWLASAGDALYGASGAVLAPAVRGGASTTDIGKELDLLADLKLSRYTDFGFQFGHLFAGSFLKRYSPGADRGFYAVFLDFHM